MVDRKDQLIERLTIISLITLYLYNNDQTMIAENTTYEAQLTEFDEYLSNISFKEKKELSEEDKVNEFLDVLSEVRNDITEKTSKLEDIIENFEKLSWFKGELDDSVKVKCNKVIASSRELSRILIRRYAFFKKNLPKGTFKKEIRDFKDAIDSFKEIVNVFETIFFELPNINSFQFDKDLLKAV